MRLMDYLEKQFFCPSQIRNELPDIGGEGGSWASVLRSVLVGEDGVFVDGSGMLGACGIGA